MFDVLLIHFFFAMTKLFAITGLNPSWPNRSSRLLRNGFTN